MGGYFSSSGAQAVQTTVPVTAANGVIQSVDRDTVIIPVDASKQAETAFEWYLHHVHKPKNFVYVVHCQELEHPDGENYPDYAVTPEAFSEQYDKAKRSGMDILAKFEKKLEDNEMKGQVQADVGRPGEIVVRAADKFNASMIVMGSRGFGVVRRTILGSVSEYVVHHAKVPVTIIPKETQHWFF